jgi:hypothetical protein
MNGLDIGTNYRFGFNTQEKEPEINPAVYSAEYWMYDGRIIRRWNVDPKVHPSYSSYSTFANNPIYYIDPLGDTTHVYNKKGIYGFTINDDRPNGQYFIGKVSKEIKEKILSDGDANMRADLVRKHSSFFIGANTVHDMQGIMKISNGEGLERPFVFYFEGGCNELRLMDLSPLFPSLPTPLPRNGANLTLFIFFVSACLYYSIIFSVGFTFGQYVFCYLQQQPFFFR